MMSIGKLMGAAALMIAAVGVGPAPISAVAAEKQITIGFAVPVLANPWWKANAEFAKKMGEALGAKVLIVDSNSQEDTQVKNIEDFIAQGVDGVIAAPITTAVGPALLKRAEDAGIKIAFAERNPGLKPDAYQGKAYVGYVGADQKAAAFGAAQALYDAGSRNIVALAGVRGMSVAEDRIAGLKAFAAAKPDFKILQIEYGAELREDGLKVTQNLLAAFPGPGFDGVWTFNDEDALGAIEALKQAGVLDKVKVSGLDADKGGIEALRKGEMLSSSGGSYLDGGFAMVMLFDAINGHAPKNPWVEMNFMAVNQSNVDTYDKEFISTLPNYDAKAMSATFTPGASTDNYVVEMK